MGLQKDETGSLPRLAFRPEAVWSVWSSEHEMLACVSPERHWVERSVYTQVSVPHMAGPGVVCHILISSACRRALSGYIRGFRSRRTGKDRDSSLSQSQPSQGDSLTINLGCSLGTVGGVLREVGCSRLQLCALCDCCVVSHDH